MIYLLDVNLLIALCDPQHAQHHEAHRWFGASPGPKWATCPLTENAFIRMTSSPSYGASQVSAAQRMRLLRKFCSLPSHVFWADDISLLDPTIWTSSELVPGSALTDLYLVALAAKKGGKLASFDRRIPAHLVRGGAEALVILSP